MVHYPGMRTRTAAMLLAVVSAIGCITPGEPRPSDAAPQIEPDKGGASRGDALRSDLQQLISAARDAVFPALVNIRVVTVVYQNGIERKFATIGSGTIFSKEGYVLTNHHVVQHGRHFICTLADRQEVPARLVGTDPLTDLAVLQLDLKAVHLDGDLPVARFGDSDALQVGETVMAMGSPLALSRSVTLGIVSNTHRILNEGPRDAEDMQLDGQTTGLFTRWIQHDALILPGSSGGPLVNLRGEVVGVNELGGNFGFAIPSDLAREVVKELVEHGEVPRSWLGFNLRPLQRTGLTEGALISSVDRDSPAQRAGLKAGDVLLALDGKPVAIRFGEEIPPFLHDLAARPAGSKLVLRVRRGSQELELTATAEKLQKDHGQSRLLRAWGFTAEQLTQRHANELTLPSTEGALVTGVKPGGPAALAEPALRQGDVVRAIDGEKVGTLAALMEKYTALNDKKEKSPRPVLLELQRKGEDQVTLLKPASSEEDDQPLEVAKGWLGVTTQPVTPELAGALGQGGAVGYRISRVYPGTTAEKAGLKVGDLIVAAGGEKFQAREASDAGALDRLVRRHYEGDVLPLTVKRAGSKDGKPVELSVVLERSRLAPEEAPRLRDAEFELSVREVTFFDRDDHSWGDAVRGVLVASIESAGWAGLAGVQPGDLIQEIGGREVHDLPSFKAALEAVGKSKPARFVIVVLRGSRTHYQFVEPDWKPLPTNQNAETGDDDSEGD